MPLIKNVTKSTWQINKTQDFPIFSTILFARLYSYFFALTRFLIKKNVMALLNVL